MRGINPNISPETGEKAIRKVFAMRFGQKNIQKIQLFRPTGNIEELIKAREKLQRKLEKVR